MNVIEKSVIMLLHGCSMSDWISQILSYDPCNMPSPSLYLVRTCHILHYVLLNEISLLGYHIKFTMSTTLLAAVKEKCSHMSQNMRKTTATASNVVPTKVTQHKTSVILHS